MSIYTYTNKVIIKMSKHMTKNFFSILQETGDSDDDNLENSPNVDELQKVLNNLNIEEKPQSVEKELPPSGSEEIQEQHNPESNDQVENTVNNENTVNITDVKQENINNEKKYSKEEYNKRPTFSYKIKDKSFPIRAGGVMFYKVNDGNIDLLLIHNNVRDYYEDFGGCTDEKDKSIEETIAREVEEESNGKFKKNNIIQRLKFAKKSYTNTSKYLMYFIQVNTEEEQYVSEDFGDKETHDNISRTINWYPLENVLKDEFISKLNPRVNNKFMIKALENLYK